MTTLEALAAQPYPGRFIILRRNTQGHDLVIYGITGRSPPSQERKIVHYANEQMMAVESTDPITTGKGNKDLLLYDCLSYTPQGIVVGNGIQTRSLRRQLPAVSSPIDALLRGVRDYDYENDSLQTPRISGVVIGNQAALSVIRGDGIKRSERMYLEFWLVDGIGRMISTYQGAMDPTPWEGDPKKVDLMYDTAQQAAEDVYAALAPERRVAVVAFQRKYGQDVVHIINKKGQGS